VTGGSYWKLAGQFGEAAKYFETLKFCCMWHNGPAGLSFRATGLYKSFDIKASAPFYKLKRPFLTVTIKYNALA